MPTWQKDKTTSKPLWQAYYTTTGKGLGTLLRA